MRQLLRLRSFWCCSLILLLLGGLWVSSRISPQGLQIHTGSEIVRLKNQAGMFEVEREIPNTIFVLPGKPRWSLDPLTYLLPDKSLPFLPPPAWIDWHDKEVTIPAGTFNIGSTNTDAWRAVLGGRQMFVGLPYWLAIIAWLLLCLPLLVWRWRAARRRSSLVPRVAA